MAATITAKAELGILTVTVNGEQHELAYEAGDFANADAVSDMAIDVLGTLGYGPDDIDEYEALVAAISGLAVSQ